MKSHALNAEIRLEKLENIVREQIKRCIIQNEMNRCCHPSSVVFKNKSSHRRQQVAALGPAFSLSS